MFIIIIYNYKSIMHFFLFDTNSAKQNLLKFLCERLKSVVVQQTAFTFVTALVGHKLRKRVPNLTSILIIYKALSMLSCEAERPF